MRHQKSFATCHQEKSNIGTAMYSVQGLGQDTVNQVLDEFLAIIKAQTSLGMGAGNYIRNVMNKALGEDKAQSVLSRIAPSTAARPYRNFGLDGRPIDC